MDGISMADKEGNDTSPRHSEQLKVQSSLESDINMAESNPSQHLTVEVNRFVETGGITLAKNNLPHLAKDLSVLGTTYSFVNDNKMEQSDPSQHLVEDVSVLGETGSLMNDDSMQQNNSSHLKKDLDALKETVNATDAITLLVKQQSGGSLHLTEYLHTLGIECNTTPNISIATKSKLNSSPLKHLDSFGETNNIMHRVAKAAKEENTSANLIEPLETDNNHTDMAMKSTLDCEAVKYFSETCTSLEKTRAPTDVILVCGEGKIEIPAQKQILSASSQYFQAMFASNGNENHSGRVDLPTVERETMEAILQFLNSARLIESDISLLMQVLTASRLLQVNDLFEMCCKMLAARMSPDSFLDIYNFAEKFEDDGLTIHVVTNLTQYFSEIDEGEDFLKLSAWQMKRIVQLIDPLLIPMDFVIKGLLRWAEADALKRGKDVLLQIVMQLDPRLISNEYLTELLRQPTIRSNPMLFYHLNNEDYVRMELVSEAIHKIDTTNRFTLSCDITQDVCTMYDVDCGQWSTPNFKNNHTKIIVFGKQAIKNTQSKHTDQCYILPFQLRFFMSFACLDGYVYAFGIYDPSDIVLKYCPTSNTIADYGTIEMPVSYPCVGVLNKDIYVVEGSLTSDAPNTVQRYTPLTNTCEMIASPNKHHTLPQVFTFSNCVYLLGCHGNENCIERYDPEKNDWTVVTIIPPVIEHPKATVCGEMLFVVPRYATGHYHIYDFSSKKWAINEFKGEGPNKIYSFHAGSVKGKHVLFAFHYSGVLYWYDLEFDQWVWQSQSKLEVISRHHALLV